MRKIVVIGSLNIDIVLDLARLPKQGETLGFSKKTSNFGGKGANQAVAAKRQGAQVSFIGALGKDSEGDSFIELFKKEGIDESKIVRKQDVDTGTAYIMLEDDGHNTILVYGGSNMALTVEDINAAADIIRDADVVVSQLEVPQEVARLGFQIAHEGGAMTILNPAPVTNEVLPALLEETDLLVPNETEAAALLNLEATTDTDKLVERIPIFANVIDIKNFVITLGEKGAFYNIDGKWGVVPSLKVDAIDTTAAGDTFIGTIATRLNPNMDNIEETLKYATTASSIVVSRPGAIPAIPTGVEVETKFKDVYK